MTMELLVNIIGWAGSLMVVITYGLNSYQKLKSDSLVYYVLNIIGGGLLIVYSIYKTAYANTFINVVWVLIAIPALIKFLRK